MYRGCNVGGEGEAVLGIPEEVPATAVTGEVAVLEH
jgi:hypothetical protein